MPLAPDLVGWDLTAAAPNLSWCVAPAVLPADAEGTQISKLLWVDGRGGCPCHVPRDYGCKKLCKQ